MIATQQELIQTFAALPPEAQRQALNFIAFLHHTYQTEVIEPSNITVRESDKQLAIAAQHREITLDDLISSIPNNFRYPDDVMDFIESEPLGRELL
jgi:hypothetical protein